MLKYKSLWAMFWIVAVWLMACSSQQGSPSNAVGVRSGPEATTGVSATNNDANTQLVEAVLAMEIIHKDEKNYIYTSQIGEVPFTYSLNQDEINATGVGKLIYTLVRPVLGNAPACNFYFEAKLELNLKATLSLTNGPADDVCHLKGTLSQTVVEPTWSVDCSNFGPVDGSVYTKAYTTSRPIDIAVYKGASDSHSVTSSSAEATLAAEDSRVLYSAIGEDLQTDFFIKNLKAQSDICQVPTPTPGP
ncbi:MAG: hypothetical protein DWQ07_22015 [Chloroflexi bacterium]|nr:MAG: hypothetical protein DWQ07_22015 [Chloroflexota bacterium]MBL1196369.1 hypothetical protein [Chloroflexota bacterium]NOH13664.1 hypothetical protein [Chloroflexota bacterium]